MSEPTLTTFRSPVIACVANEDWPKKLLPTGPCALLRGDEPSLVRTPA